MRACFDGEQWWQEACDNTVRVAAMIEDDVLPEHRLHLPVYDVAAADPQFVQPEADRTRGMTLSASYLKHLVGLGMRRRRGLAGARLTRRPRLQIAHDCVGRRLLRRGEPIPLGVFARHLPPRACPHGWSR